MSTIAGMLTSTQAPGEAEAELAYLNSIGEIDAVLSDDVDTFLFGATMVIRKYGRLIPHIVHYSSPV
jgi:5'-3' exonuclease